MAPSTPVSLPRVSFRLVSPPLDYPSSPAFLLSFNGKHANNLTKNLLDEFGYNPLVEKPFVRGEHYGRYIEPIEVELAHQVEYDMDEQDREWVDQINIDRQAQHLDRLSYELFEIIMDKLEKEWFNLIKRIPPPTSSSNPLLPSHEDSKCSICDDGEGENSNAIVFCDGCNLAVHQDCYGVPYIPEGQWLCRKCTVEPENPVDCVFCPAEAGAFKQTTDARWAHLLCAMWIPEVGVSNPVYMEPVEGIETVPKSRWRLICAVCKLKGGACIQCDNKNCFTAFHVTCGRQYGLLGSMKSLLLDGILRAYCPRHIPAEQGGDPAEDEDDLDSQVNSSNRKRDRDRDRKKRKAPPANFDITPLLPVLAPLPKEAAKSARAHAKKYKQGPPLVPAVIVEAIVEYIKRARLKRMKDCVERVCRYWSLKREARRGAPLLKRLHLEPWTQSNVSKEQTDAEKAKKLEYMVTVRNDLERIRMLVELVRKREKDKLRQARILKDLLEEILFPHDGKLRLAYEKIVGMDRQMLFQVPVSVKDVPDYYDVIKEPMFWQTIDEKLESHKYTDLSEFQYDILLVLDNAMIYNPSDNPYHKAAHRIKKASRVIFQELAEEIKKESDEASNATATLAALEPPLSSIAPLVMKVGDGPDMISQLLSFEPEPLKIAPPKKIPKPRQSVSTAERRARREEKAARADLMRVARATRGSGMAVEEMPVDPSALPKELRPPPIKPPGRHSRNERPGSEAAQAEQSQTERPAVRQYGRKGKARAERPADPEPDVTSTPHPRKREAGVIGLERFSPLTDKQRRERERAMDLTVPMVDEKEVFKRFNVGWVLPEGSRRTRKPVPSSVAGPSGVNRASSEARASAITDVAPPPRPRAFSFGSSDISSAPAESPTKNPLASPLSPLSPALPSAQAGPSRRYPGRQLQLPDIGATKQSHAAKSNISSPLTSASRSDGSQAGPQAESSKQANDGDQQKERTATPAATVTDVWSEVPEQSESKRVPKKRKASDDGWQPPSKRKQTGGTVGSSSRTASSPSKTADPKGKGKEVVRPEPHDAKEKKTEPVVNDTSSEAEEEIYQQRMRTFKGLCGTEEDEVEGDLYPFGTLVWAKMTGFPFFPAEICCIPHDYDEIPEAVWEAQPPAMLGPSAPASDEAAPVEDHRYWLIRFFDARSTYGWCKADQLAGLGDDAAQDRLFLTGKGRGTRKDSRFDRMAKDIRKAYRDATAQMEIPEDIQAAEQEAAAAAAGTAGSS